MADKYPWFPFYANKFLSDEKVLVMNYREVGIYLVLLCHQWVQGSIPADLSRAQAMLKLGSSVAGDDADFVALERVMDECFVPHPELAGRLINPKLADVQDSQEAKRQKLSEGGKRGVDAKRQAQATLKAGSSHPQADKRERKNKKTTMQPPERRDDSRGWTTQAGEAWAASRGEPPFARIGKALKPLVERHGARQTLAVWEGYLLDRAGKSFCTPEDFVGNYKLHREKWGWIMGDDGFTKLLMADEPEATA